MEELFSQEELDCICFDPDTQEPYNRVCLARRLGGVCPQLPVLERIQAQLSWLVENEELKQESMCIIEAIRFDIEEAQNPTE